MTNSIGNEEQRQAAYHRMAKIFPVNRGLHSIFSLMVNAHRYAIDYIEQAPVIVLAATAGNGNPQFSERAFLQEQLGKLCKRGVQLRDVLRVYGLPLPLRLLNARALTSTRATAVRRLALMNPSTLAQIIPATPQKQNAWLQALQNWCDAMAMRAETNNNQCLLFEWAAINYPGITYRETGGVRHMVDFVCAHQDTFNPRWTLNRARAEEQRWHADLAIAKMAESHGVRFDEAIDCAPLPRLWTRGHLSFVALQSGKALHAEGAAMHHCVATYWRNVIEGRSRIYSILENGNRVATLEVSNRLSGYNWGTSRYQVRQLVGTCNSRPTPEVAQAVGTFVYEINDRVGERGPAEMTEHNAISAVRPVGVVQ